MKCLSPKKKYNSPLHLINSGFISVKQLISLFMINSLLPVTVAIICERERERERERKKNISREIAYDFSSHDAS